MAYVQRRSSEWDGRWQNIALQHGASYGQWEDLVRQA